LPRFDYDAGIMRLDAQSSDGSLIAAALAGDEPAFALLVERYRAPLSKAAHSRLGRRELAEEAVQETFLCAHRWLGTYDSRYSFRTWLWTILLNQCTRLAKREARHGSKAEVASVSDAALSGNVCRLASPLDQLLARERSEQLHELLARLPEPQADALRLRFFGGLTFPELAAAMGCSEPGAKHRIKAALLKLSQWMQSDQAPRDPDKSIVKTGQAGSLPYDDGDNP
jgi:RNA polymerase sigma-70 factor, ECF subfamily